MKGYATWLLKDPGREIVDFGFLDPVDLEEEPVPEWVLQSDGRVVVERMIESLELEGEIRGLRPLVVITSRDLFLPGTESLYGYADPDRGICLVSTARIQLEPEKFEARLENVVRHELGHLSGLAHCDRRGCLMKPVSSLEEIDQRSGEPCLDCLRSEARIGGAFRVALGSLVLILLLAALNLAAVILEPSPRSPFDVESGDPGTTATLSFNNDEFWSSDSCELSPGLEETLNLLFREVDPLPVTVSGSGSDRASLMANGAELLSLNSEEAHEQADRLATQLNVFFEAKGSEASSCAACHLERKPEVLEAAYGRKWVFDRINGFSE